MFFDEAEIFVQSGRGGDGWSISIRKSMSRGAARMGAMAAGVGDVILEVNPKINTLFDFSHRSQYFADSGKPGGPNNMSGKSASDLVINVPRERWFLMPKRVIC